jgi:isopentenyl diphosphate isomerase/L-lactate dehydrogenase-like FMN-dependent dehydrogenase
MDDRTVIRDLEGFHDRWLLTVVVLGVLAFAGILTVVIAGFRHNHVYRSADAMTLVVPPPPRMLPEPPAAPPR